jgi:hypothetical protein
VYAIAPGGVKKTITCVVAYANLIVLQRYVDQFENRQQPKLPAMVVAGACPWH